MTKFDPKFFRKAPFSNDQIQHYFQAALHDADISKRDTFPEVKFTYGYQALIKAGIALLACAGQVKVRSVPGHHIKILEKMGEILNDPDVTVLGNAMRNKRNLDLYEGGQIISEKEVDDYQKFVASVILKIEKVIGHPKRI